MSKLDNFLTIKDAMVLLQFNGVEWSEIYLRMLCGTGKVKSVKQFNSRLIPREEVSRIIESKKHKARATGRA
jgi:hypothetical protein